MNIIIKIINIYQNYLVIKKNPLIAANNGLATIGYYLEVKDNLDLPITIYYQFNSKADQKQIHQKNYILLNKNSKAVIFEKFLNDNKKTFITINTNIDVEKNLSLKIGNVFKIEGNEYEITDIQFKIIPNEWGLDYLKGNKTLDIVDEEEDVMPTNSEILIFIKLL